MKTTNYAIVVLIACTLSVSLAAQQRNSFDASGFFTVLLQDRDETDLGVHDLALSSINISKTKLGYGGTVSVSGSVKRGGRFVDEIIDYRIKAITASPAKVEFETVARNGIFYKFTGVPGWKRGSADKWEETNVKPRRPALDGTLVEYVAGRENRRQAVKLFLEQAGGY